MFLGVQEGRLARIDPSQALGELGLPLGARGMRLEARAQHRDQGLALGRRELEGSSKHFSRCGRHDERDPTTRHRESLPASRLPAVGLKVERSLP